MAKAVKKTKHREEEEEERPTKKVKAKKEAANDPAAYVPYDMMEVLGDLEKKVRIQSITIGAESRASTGLLCMDLVLGSGITAGMYTFAGPEQSAKTTLALTILAASVKQNVGLRCLWDAENSSGSSMDYVENIFTASGVKVDMETLFGERKDGKYITKPVIYYRDEGEMDTFYNWLSALLRKLPDKRFEAGTWWFVYENTPENKAKYKSVLNLKMSRANDSIYIPAPDGSLQAMVLVDSYPSLLPDSMDVDDPKIGMALQAREFSKHIPRVKGKLRKKRVAILGINQLRENPMAKFQDPRYEPGGAALKFNSDARIHTTPRALSGVIKALSGMSFSPKGKGQYEEEESLNGGVDIYRYVHAKAIKNKLSLPNRETWLRIWVSDEDSKAQGFCPVWDTFYAMYLTGQISGKRQSMTLNLYGMGEAKRTVNWTQFKRLILGTKEEMTTICTKIGYRPMNLRKGLFALMKKGKMEELYSARHKAMVSKKAKSGEEDDDDDSDD